MSVNLLLPREDEPVIWRGPILANMVKTVLTDVIWGELDYLFVDMPPGTGDVPLTVFQSLPVEGIVIVSSPQDLVKMIVRKAYKMAQMMKINVLVLWKTGYLVCPDCGKHISVFGESHIDEIVAALGTEVLGKMPINPLYAEAADKGAFHAVENEYLDKAVEKSLDNPSEEQCENAVPFYVVLTKFEKEKLIFKRILPALNCKRFQCGENAGK